MSSAGLLKRVRDLLSYDPETGFFVWRVDTRRAKAGDRAGAVRGSGYLAISVDGVQFYSHRLAIFYTTGNWPAGVVDHIDGDRQHNALGNLRDVTLVVNMQNQRRPRSVNPHGLIGVSVCRNKYRAGISVDGRCLHLGVFDTAEAAHAAYIKAKRELHEGCTI